MAAFNKFQPFVEAMAEKKHDLGADQLVIALTNAANPPVTGDGVLADETEIAYTNLSSRNVTTSSSVQTAGVYKLICADLVLTASGAVAAFRYPIMYNTTATNDELIGWWDYLSDLALAASETFTIDFDGTGGVLTVT